MKPEDVKPIYEGAYAASSDKAFLQTGILDQAIVRAVARAFRHSSPRRSVLSEHIVSGILERGKGPDSFNPLQAAMATSALLKFKPTSGLATDAP